MDAPEAGVLPRDLVFVDLETTGGNAAHHRITEIGIVRVQDDVVVEEWSTLVNPECVIPEYIERFTGISNEMVEGAPRFADVAPLVLERLRGAAAGADRTPPVFAAHNARFDYSFLRAEFRRAGISFSAPVLCTVKLSRRLFPEHPRHNLDAVMERHALSCDARHRALGDARVIREFWSVLRASTPEPDLAAAVRSAQNTIKLPAHLPEGLADELPEGAGTYRFLGSDGTILFVGKSGCVRSAVLAHFAGRRDPRRGHWLEEVRGIEWVETAGELGAMLRELDDIKHFDPPHNRRPSSRAADCTLKIADDSGAAEVLTIAESDPAELERCFGVFHSPKDARKALIDIAKAKRLCLKMLGVEQAEGSCLAHQLGSCKGACVGKEPAALHAVRVRMALVPLKLKSWPFPGRIALRERRAFREDDVHVVDRWHYLGTARSEEELAALATRPAPARFDVQLYRILVRYLANHPKLDWLDLEARRPVRDDGAFRAADVA
jgi:DNA polymerase III subunit epsilon